MFTIRQLPVLLVFIFELTNPVVAGSSGASAIRQDIEQLLHSGSLTTRGVEILTNPQLFDVYQLHEFAPFWNRPGRIKELTELIRNSVDHGLLPADYNIGPLEQVLQQYEAAPSVAMDASTDILLTESLLRYCHDRRFGKTSPSAFDSDINYSKQDLQQPASMVEIEALLESASLTDFIQRFAPMGPAYERLQASLKHYREIAGKGGWPGVPEGLALHPGDDDARVRDVRKRLAATGLIKAGYDSDSTFFDKTLEEAVKIFQLRHQLDQDGIVGVQTLGAMNVPVEHRVDQLRLSLERLRWVNPEAADTLLMINIAGFVAFFYKNGVIEWDTRVIIGTDYRPTPVLRSDIAYLEFNPSWTIPPSILRDDVLPAIRKNPDYLALNNISVIDNAGNIVDPSTVNWHNYRKAIPYILRQAPGPDNPLGTVKFIFPNKQFIFLHDTPHRELFAMHERDFSSGCIRVEDPLRLAELVLNDPLKYNRSALESIVASRETRRVSVSPTVPVVVIYLTASVSADGQTYFYRDIYARDERALDALNGPSEQTSCKNCLDSPMLQLSPVG